MDILGKIVFATTTDKTEIDLSNLHSGIYIIKIEEAGRAATRKLFIR